MSKQELTFKERSLIIECIEKYCSKDSSLHFYDSEIEDLENISKNKHIEDFCIVSLNSFYDFLINYIKFFPNGEINKFNLTISLLKKIGLCISNKLNN